MNEIDNYARRIEAKHALFIFDSCFSGSLLTKRRSNIPPIITLKTTQPVRQFITAGADDQEVPDVSIFRRQFVEGINGEADTNNDGYITGSELADYLQEKVGNYTRLSQTPQYGKIFDPLLDKGDFVFTLNKGGSSAQNQATTISEPVKNNPVNNVSSDPLAELDAWNKIKTATTAAEFQSFLQQFPNGAFAKQARVKMNEIGDPEWNQVKNSKDATAYRDYINKNPNSPFVESARENLKILAESMIAWEQIKDSNKYEDFENYLKKYPNSPNSIDARKSIEPLMAGRTMKNSLGIEFVYIPAGEFMMGSPENEKDRDKDEGPQRKVTISRGFWMSKYLMTREDLQIIGQYKEDKCSKCIGFVKWQDTKDFVNELNVKNDGFTYSIPTEAEWEYSARAGTSTRYFWGDSISEEEKYNLTPEDWNKGFNFVGKKMPNQFGIYDAYLFTGQWTEDIYSATFEGLPTDGSANLTKGNLKERVQRGVGRTSRSANREKANIKDFAAFRIIARPRE